MAIEASSLAFMRTDGRLTVHIEEPEGISRNDGSPTRIPTDAVRDPAFALRLGPPNAKYVASLMCLNGHWPPILVSRRGNTVIDGRHRLIAARRLGHATIEVVFLMGLTRMHFSKRSSSMFGRVSLSPFVNGSAPPNGFSRATETGRTDGSPRSVRCRPAR